MTTYVMLTTIFISHINACKRFSQCTHVEIHTRGTNIITTGSAHACTQTHTHNQWCRWIWGSMSKRSKQYVCENNRVGQRGISCVFKRVVLPQRSWRLPEGRQCTVDTRDRGKLVCCGRWRPDRTGRRCGNRAAVWGSGSAADTLHIPTAAPRSAAAETTCQTS